MVSPETFFALFGLSSDFFYCVSFFHKAAVPGVITWRIPFGTSSARLAVWISLSSISAPSSLPSIWLATACSWWSTPTCCYSRCRNTSPSGTRFFEGKRLIPVGINQNMPQKLVCMYRRNAVVRKMRPTVLQRRCSGLQPIHIGPFPRHALIYVKRHDIESASFNTTCFCALFSVFSHVLIRHLE